MRYGLSGLAYLLSKTDLDSDMAVLTVSTWWEGAKPQCGKRRCSLRPSSVNNILFLNSNISK